MKYFTFATAVAVLALTACGQAQESTREASTQSGVDKNETAQIYSGAGKVTAIAGDQVTFDVIETFVGEVSDEVTLTASGMTGTSVTSAGGPNLSVGERYLVAGDGEFAWACGFTQPYDDAIAAEWADATR